MSAQVFISYSNQDRAVAESIHDALEEAGIPAWLAHRDLTAGVSWSQRIVDEIHSSRVLVLVLSRHANDSRYVVREVAEAVDSQTSIVTVRIEDVVPSNALKFFIAAEQWLDAYAMPRQQYQRRLVDAVRLLLAASTLTGAAVEPPAHTGPMPPSTTTARRIVREHRGVVRVTIAVLAVTAAIIIGTRILAAFEAVVTIADQPAELLVGDSILLALASNHDAAVWSSSNPEVMSISPDTRVSRAIGEGRAWLIAKAGSKSDSVIVTVKRPPADSISIASPRSAIRVGDSLGLTVLVYDRALRQITDPGLRWSTDAPGIAAVNDRGVVDAIAPGHARITARADSVSASVDVTVSARSPRSPAMAASPERQPTDTDRPEIRALPREAELTRAANLCIEALKKGDIQWISANYKPPTPADQSNLDRLTTVMRQARYTVSNSAIGVTQPENRSADFWAEFRYTASFGRTVRARSTFRVLTENSTGTWRLDSCRTVGSIETS